MISDRRDGLQRAVNIELVHVSVKNGEIRENVGELLTISHNMASHSIV